MQKMANETPEIDLDHIGFIVEDLVAARAFFSGLGFTLTQRADHTRTNAQGEKVSAGSSQHSIMFDVGYIELMQITDPQAGHQLTPAIHERYGMHVLALGTRDARSWHAQCLRNGIAPRDVMDWSRQVETPERSGMARFLYFDAPWQASDPSYLCWVQHATPELVRSPSLLQHANSARALRVLHYAGPAVPLAAWSARLQRAGARASHDGQSGRLTLGPSAIDLEPREVMDWSRLVETPERSGMARFIYFDAPWQASDPSYLCWVQHATPELVRSPSLLKHANGARALRVLHYAGPADPLAAWSARLQRAGARASHDGQSGRLALGPSAIDLQPRDDLTRVLPTAMTVEFADLDEIARRADLLKLPCLQQSAGRMSLDLRPACGLVLHAVQAG